MAAQNDALAQLRIALDAPNGFDRFEHQKRTENVRQSHPHTVRYREFADGATCLTYALRLFESRIYEAISGDFFHRKIWAGRQFVEWLPADGRLEQSGKPMPECLVLYFADGVWQHAGTASEDGRVVSKWGEFPVFDHDAFEVPARYGNEVRYYVMPRPENALKLFVEFVKSLGVSDEDIAVERQRIDTSILDFPCFVELPV